MIFYRIEKIAPGGDPSAICIDFSVPISEQLRANVSRIDGVSEVTPMGRYRIWVHRGLLFPWSDLIPELHSACQKFEAEQPMGMSPGFDRIING